MRAVARFFAFCAMAAATLAVLGIPAVAQEPCPCQLPDNTGGTITLPPACPEGYSGHLQIVDGVVGGTIEIDVLMVDLANVVEVAGGGLGGTQSTFDAILTMDMAGTGALAGFNRFINMPVSGVIDWGPRVPNTAVQTFPGEIVQLSGSIFGDPDFDQLEFRTGNDFLLPAPGQTTLTRLGGIGSDFQVDSFFDIVYEIEFVGQPGSVLEDMQGTTTSETRLEICPGASPVEESTWGSIKALYRDLR